MSLLERSLRFLDPETSKSEVRGIFDDYQGRCVRELSIDEVFAHSGTE